MCNKGVRGTMTGHFLMTQMPNILFDAASSSKRFHEKMRRKKDNKSIFFL